MESHILLSCDIPSDRILITKESEPTTPDLHDSVERIWKEQQKIAKKNGVKLWDSIVYRYEDSYITGGKVMVMFSTMHYKEVFAMKEKGIASKFCFVSGLIETSDGLFVFGKRGKHLVKANTYDFIGGVMSETEREVKEGEDIQEMLFSELEEEINVHREVIKECHLRQIIATDTGSVGFIFYTKLNITGEEVKMKFMEKNDGEMAEVVLKSMQEVPDFLDGFAHYVGNVKLLLAV